MPLVETDAISRCIALYERFMEGAREGTDREMWRSPIPSRAREQLQYLLAGMSRAVSAEEKLARLPQREDVEMAIRANGSQDNCDCDPSVGMSSCRYCAIDSVLHRLLRVVMANYRITRGKPERRHIMTVGNGHAEDQNAVSTSGD